MNLVVIAYLVLSLTMGPHSRTLGILLPGRLIGWGTLVLQSLCPYKDFRTSSYYIEIKIFTIFI